MSLTRFVKGGGIAPHLLLAAGALLLVAAIPLIIAGAVLASERRDVLVAPSDDVGGAAPDSPYNEAALAAYRKAIASYDETAAASVLATIAANVCDIPLAAASVPQVIPATYEQVGHFVGSVAEAMDLGDTLSLPAMSPRPRSAVLTGKHNNLVFGGCAQSATNGFEVPFTVGGATVQYSLADVAQRMGIQLTCAQATCTASAMRSVCRSMDSSASYAAHPGFCAKGDLCGVCSVSYSAAELCIVVDVKPPHAVVFGAAGTGSKNCFYPALVPSPSSPTTLIARQAYYVAPREANGTRVTVRLSNDPYLVLQRATKGTANFTLAEGELGGYEGDVGLRSDRPHEDAGVALVAVGCVLLVLALAAAAVLAVLYVRFNRRATAAKELGACGDATASGPIVSSGSSWDSSQEANQPPSSTEERNEAVDPRIVVTA